MKSLLNQGSTYASKHTLLRSKQLFNSAKAVNSRPNIRAKRSLTLLPVQH